MLRRRGRRPSRTRRCATASGRLRHEECLTRDGFDGPFTIMYHVERPHTAAVTTADARLGDPRGRRRRAARRWRAATTDRRSCRAGAGRAIDARVPLLFNDDVVISVVHPDEADPVYFANGDGDDLYFVRRGRRRAALARWATSRSRRATTCSCPRACPPLRARRSPAVLAVDRVRRRLRPAAAVAQRGRPAAHGRALQPPRLSPARASPARATRGCAIW